MLDFLTDFLKNINDNYAQVFLLLIAVLSTFFVYNEFVLKIRPYVIPEIAVELKDGNWYFNIVLINKGEKPGIARIINAVLKIGDEKYPTLFELNLVLAPNERQRVLPIGHISSIGRTKILGHEYVDNNVQIFLEIESKAIGDKKFKYKTKEEYRVDVSGSQPRITLIKEDLN
ncbi:MAG: hypothetical protein A3I26_02000 [Candidatus Yanofskybacteria bacterium RIFCSPLOWO2_02_FULL_43_10]|uniref:DUF11 domain-containing protein n=1 Tax=Candidatus Yanofskybacteria bacterium RIFCSPLOWO2_12_FULL_43_11b TaxID=1802710 RepID=A0A1F8H8M9_9BACT|nr:MAG: hypothetical protein A2742_02765 [Candidatus Yanofskybacteria bacterium RIFCSPHIGHO2_01_FULL_43_32]OGN12058.1 MAG: hypothetical protein A3C69_00530 [Candidatus Yanofskybacteria bacterium RIFCSPHIGHO2_02_FULL_43_12]OGN17567.1 MAG: hypothetical protein A3E34_03340 [Candidatus Yanofskybacteria bacterium RIFCSPHIGHO2_12_FULL_43_11]OGN25078.1 MAG: hypothetical protein A2923_01720 [Candidatus Yanofskybacteria bacterium RIFCSPLOWO2_01_FULL_43_46]OGN28733.1 MAG: hypothetical protein A3I26_02000